MTRHASYTWILKSSGLKGTHNIVWPDSYDTLSTPSLTTGLTKMGVAINDDKQEWKQAIGSGNLEKYRNFLKEKNLDDSDNIMEATACQNGFIPEGRGVRVQELEWRIGSSLPHLAYMVSRTRNH